MKKSIVILTIIGTLMITTGLIITLVDNHKMKKCYNMPLNEFKESKMCKKYNDNWQQFLDKYYKKNN